jgi:4-hydroxybenzoate polyprenyltransferase
MPSGSPPPARLPFLALLRRGTDALLYSSTLVAAAAAALTGATFRFWRAPMPVHLAGLIFAATLFLYNIDSVLPYKYQQQAILSERKLWLLAHRRVLFGLALASLAVAAVLFWQDGWRHLTLFLGHLAAISLLYSMPVVRRHGRWRALRDLPLLKIFLIAYVWSAITVWVPALYLHRPLSEPVVTGLFARRFFFILNLALIFDIRDYTKDRLSGTRTFPGLFGLRATKGLGLFFLGVSALILPPGTAAPAVALLTLPIGLAALVLWHADETRPDYYFALLADGLMLVQAAAAYWATA